MTLPCFFLHIQSGEREREKLLAFPVSYTFPDARASLCWAGCGCGLLILGGGDMIKKEKQKTNSKTFLSYLTLRNFTYYSFINCSLQGSNYALAVPLGNCCFQTVTDANSPVSREVFCGSTGTDAITLNKCSDTHCASHWG